MEVKNVCESCSNSLDTLDNYCSSCGESQNSSDRKNSNSQTLVFLAVTFLFAAAIIWFITYVAVEISDNYMIYEKTEWLNLIVRLTVISVPLLLALSLRAGGKKTLAIIFASIYTAIELYWFIKGLMPVEEFAEFQF